MSKENILQAIRNNKPSPTTLLPEVPIYAHDKDLLQTFTKNARASNSRVIPWEDIIDLDQWIRKEYKHCQRIASTWSDNPGNVSLDQVHDPKDLRDVDLAIVRSSLGVAENGAIWISDRQVPDRILPFITQHLVVVLDLANIVENMHIAYDRIQLQDIGFGVFIAGPSKTADIEQSLVVGAQGARSHTVLVKSYSEG